MLGHEINVYRARTVPEDGQRFTLLLHDASDWLVAGLSRVLPWQCPFVEAQWVSDIWRSRGIGRALLAQAEAAVCVGCHSAWRGYVSGAVFLPGAWLSAVRGPR